MSTDAQKPQLPLIPALTTQSGRYVHVTETGREWEYAYDIHAAGTRSERRIGQLRAEGLQRVIAAARPGDAIQTPWGVMARMSDSMYERGFLLERTQGQPIDTSQGAVLDVPENMLSRAGRWRAQVGPWRYAAIGMAMGSRSERRIGRLHFGQTEIRGKQQGDYVDSPWGRLRWMGPINLEGTTDYEQGFLLRGTYDRSLDEQGVRSNQGARAPAAHFAEAPPQRGERRTAGSDRQITRGQLGILAAHTVGGSTART